MTIGESSKRGKGVSGHEQGGKYARYNEEQIEVLEKAYAESPNPNHFQRAQLMREQPALSGIDNKQLKVWFQNRRCREKQKKESGDLVLENRRLTAANKLLREENDELQRQLAQLIYENQHLRNQVLNSTTSHITTSDLGHQLKADHPLMAIMVADNSTGLLSLAEEIKNEFLSKAIGTAINWVPVPGMKLHNPGTIYIPSTCIGVAARASATVPFEPKKTLEMLKDRPSWSRFCRSIEVHAEHPAENGGTIELVYTKYYAPTTMALARDFWSLRYSSVLDDGSFVVCEKSTSGSNATPSSPDALEFVRGRILCSGYMICPAEGGSTIHLVEHWDLEASSVPEVVRPLYESSELLAKRTVVSAIRFFEHVANETSGKLKRACREDPALLRSFSQKLSRAFSDAVNCFSDDGWTFLDANSFDDINMSYKRTKNFGVYENCDSILCLKASLLLQNVYPASLVKLLKERRSRWMGFNFADHSVASRPAASAFPGLNTDQRHEFPVLLGHTHHEHEALEIIRLDGSERHRNVYNRDLYHLQMSNGMEDDGFGACSELIFAPIDRTLPNNAAQLSCGFRVCLLGSHTASFSHPPSVLILAFQFPYESQYQNEVATVAQLYVQHVIASVKNISLELTPSKLYRNMNSTDANLAMVTPETTSYNLTNLICQCYRSCLVVDILGFDWETSDDLMLEQMQNHQYAILCFSFTSIPVCAYANQSALNMLETIPGNLHMLTMDSVFSGSSYTIYSVLSTIMQQGYVILPSGRCVSALNRTVSFEQGVVWRVRAPDGSFHGLGFGLIDWSFVKAV